MLASQRALEQLTIDTGVWLDEQCADDVGDLRSDTTVRRGEDSAPVVSERLLAAQAQLRRLAEEGDRLQGPPDDGQEQPMRDGGSAASAGEQSGGAGRLSPLSAFE